MAFCAFLSPELSAALNGFIDPERDYNFKVFSQGGHTTALDGSEDGWWVVGCPGIPIYF